MTVRSIIIGLMTGLAIAAFGYFNDRVMRQSFLTTNLAPVCVYGMLVLGLLILNPLLKAIRLRPFRAAEWCVIIALALVACVVPGPGLMWHFSNTLVMPHQFNAVTGGWRTHKLMSYVPEAMLVDPVVFEGDNLTDEQDLANAGRREEVVNGFKSGLGTGDEMIPPEKVPWDGWKRTLWFWLPLIGFSYIAEICLVLVLHGQWSRRERLRYPVAYVASEMISGSGGDRYFGSIFHNKMFWLGFGVPAVILLINGYHSWNPDSINIPMGISLQPLFSKWDFLEKAPSAWRLKQPVLYFSAVGFAYFVSSEISFSLGISSILFAAVFLSCLTLGISVSGAPLVGGNHAFQMFGSYLGMCLVIIYTGRKYFLSVFSGAFGVRGRERIDRSVVWAFRVVILSLTAMVLMLVFVIGLHWLVATLAVLLIMMMFTVITRIHVETGLFMIQSGWYAVGILLATFGFAAIGPHMLIILGILCVAISLDPIVCLMPLAANAFKIAETARVRPSRINKWMILCVLLALVVGVGATIWIQYSFGGCRYGWADSTAKAPFNLLLMNLQKFAGDLPDHAGFNLSAIRARSDFLGAAGIGLVVVLTLSALRLRFRWWPIHPVLFLVWGTFPTSVLAPSLLMGWMIKTAITTFGGGKTFQHSKPFFIGLIAGEFVAAIFWMAVGMVHYLQTHVPPEHVFRILPD